MCGICGLYNFSGEIVSKDSLCRMTKLMAHRGPDGEGIELFHNIGLGHRRLSIIDLHSRGNQPMVDSNCGNWIVYNGEVYNYIELRDELKDLGYVFVTETDSEVILNAYNAWGKKAFSRLNGMFAFCIFSPSSKKLICVRDRYGIKPLYYYVDDKSFIFSSEIKPILTYTNKKFKINREVAFNYLIFGRADYNNETFFADINRLSPGHYIEIYPNGPSGEVKWWSPRINRVSYDHQLLKKIFEDSVKLRMRSDVPVGSCLSGGIDSTAIVNLASRMIQKEFQTFSAVYDKNWKYDEEKYIRIVGEKHNIVTNFTRPNKEKLLMNLDDLIYYQEEPFTSTAIYSQWEVMCLANKNSTKVLLDGQGADEIMCGYHYFFSYYLFELLTRGKFLKMFITTYEVMRNTKNVSVLMFFFYLLLPNKLKSALYLKKNNFFSRNFFRNEIKENKVIEQFVAANSIEELSRNHIKYKLQHLLRYEDKNSMAFSIESRTPFLDYRLVEYCLNAPSEFHIKRGFTKYSFRKAMVDVVEKEILMRKDKIGFKSMQEKWIRSKDFKKIFHKIVTSEKFVDRGLYDNTKIVKLTEKFINNKNVDLKVVWRIFNFEIWCRLFIDDIFKTQR